MPRKGIIKILVHFFFFFGHMPLGAKTEFKHSASNGSDKKLENLFPWPSGNNGLSVSAQMYGYNYNVIFF